MKKYLFIIAMSIILTQNTFAARTQYLEINKSFTAGSFGANGEASTASCSSQYAFDKSEYEPNATATITIIGSGESATEGSNGGSVTCNSTASPATLGVKVYRLNGGSTEYSGNVPKTITVPTAVGAYTIPATLEMLYRNTRNTTSGSIDYQVLVNSAQPSLQLNGHAAFLNTFFTATYAQDKKITSTVIADVEIQQARIISQENRIIKASITLQNRIGTQSGILYGIQVYKKDEDKNILLDEYAIQDALILNQNQSVTKEVIYAVPLSISGDVELFMYTSTNKGILLGAAPLGTVALPTTKLALSLNSCSRTDQTFTCSIQNTANVAATTTLVTTVKAGTSAFGTILDIYNTPIVLQKKETRNINQTIRQSLFTQNLYLESTLFNAEGFPISRKTNIYIHPVKKVSIDNILVEQISKKDYSVKVVSLTRSTDPHSVTATLNDINGACATATTPMVEVNTMLTLSSKKACTPSTITVIVKNNKGEVIDTVTQAYESSWTEDEKKMNQNTSWFIGGLLAAVLLILFLISRRKESTVV